MQKKDYYQILNVEKTASQKDIKKAYRKIAKKYHPDINHGNTSAENKFKEATEAYEILGDENKRKNYDMYGNPEGEGQWGGFENVFEEMSQFFQRSRTMEEIHANISIKIEDILTKSNQQAEYTYHVKCTTCNGIGTQKKEDIAVCGNCHGSGRENVMHGNILIQSTCRKCGGVGKTIKNPCPNCYGSGKVAKQEKVTIEIPAGIQHGTRFRIKKEENVYIIITVNILKHKIFSRYRDTDLICHTSISPIDAIVGCQKNIINIHGEKIGILIPANTKDGDVVCVNGGGIIANGRSGKMIVVIHIQKEASLSHEQIEILKKIQTENYSDRENNNIDTIKHNMELSKRKSEEMNS